MKKSRIVLFSSMLGLFSVSAWSMSKAGDYSAGFYSDCGISETFPGVYSVSAANCKAKSLYKKEEQTCQSFPLEDVRLLDGPFKHAMEMDRQWLLKLEPDRLMNGFLQNAGLSPKAPKYGGWEGGGLAGQTFGHFLSACSMMYASTGDEAMKKIVDYCVSQLDSCQKTLGTGLVAGFPDACRLFEEIGKGDIRTKGFDLNGYYVPLYNMHKLMAGLSDAYRHAHNDLAKDVLISLANYMYGVFSPLSDAQIQEILKAEHGGINESFAEVYALTNDSRYLELSERLNHKYLLDPLSEHRDELAGKHANTQIPKIVGVARQYELSGDKKLLDIADFFWNTVVDHHTYVIGGNSEAEHFGAPDRTYDRITDKTCETCNSYNMLKLTKHLFMASPDVKKVDFYERVLYNHILASQNPDDGMVCYMSPLASGCRKDFSSPFDSFWCCVGTGLENHSKYGDFIYSTNGDNDLYINLFIPSVLNWRAEGAQVTMNTDFPNSGSVAVDLKLKRSRKFAVNIRYPYWAKNGCDVFINGEKQIVSNAGPGSYLKIERKWSDGDRLEFVYPMSFSSEQALGDSTLRAYLYGPIVLALPLNSGEDVPVVLTEKVDDAESAIFFDGEKMQLKSAWPSSHEMKPYYKSTGDRTVVYFEHYNLDKWLKESEDILAKRDREKWMKQRTVAYFQPGEMQPERDFSFDGNNIELGDMSGKKFRKAVNGGSFSFKMPVKPDVPMDMICTYWGNLGDIYKFKVKVDGVPIATVIIHWWGNSFFDKVYHIPFEVTKGKDNVLVEFEAMDNTCVAGPLFGCRMLIR